MKNIVFAFLFLSTTIFAQQFEKKWDKIIALEKEGKIKSSNEIVAEIYKKAKVSKDEEQIIKCFFFQSKYMQILEENAQTKIINNLKSTINQVSVPSKAILNIVYAKCLNDYFSRNNYQIRQRTNIETADSNFLTWTQKNFDTQINSAMKQTLQNENALKNTPLSKYESIFDYASSEKFKTENLYNYILKENITFYTQKLQTWNISKIAFIPYKKDFFGDSSTFIKLNLDFINDENLRSLISLYQKKENNSPTLDNQFERLLFCKNFLFQADDDYYKALATLQKKAEDKILIQKIQLEKVQYLLPLASKTLHPDYNTKALAILDSVIQVNNRSNEYKKAISQKQKLLTKSLTVQLQKYIYNNENTRAFIQYKNVEHLKISFYKINQKQISFFMAYQNPRDAAVDEIVKNKQPERTETYELKNKKDCFQYSTEVLLPNLKTGSYLVYFETEKDTKDQKVSTYETITVTNFTIAASEANMTETYQVLDRKNGNPLQNAKVTSPKFTALTDKNGTVSYKKTTNDRDYETLQVSLENDTIAIGTYYFQRSNIYQLDTPENSKAKVEFYLDRAIYRPGQTVYFKGIAIQKNNDKTTVVPYTTFTIIIKDADQNDFNMFDITTNEFGSFSGEFVLPKTGLTGNFSITAKEPDELKKDKFYDKEKKEHPFWDNVDFSYSALNFKVEEYKRPKFEVTFDPKKETFQVNQSVKVKGTAKAFAGSNVSDAEVSYTVTRFTSYHKNYFGREDEEEIADGEIKTDASGKFVIDFIALPPEDSAKEKLPVFTYEIEVSVTDINGETHDSRTQIIVGYHDLILETAMPSKIQTKDKNEIILTSTNLNGEFKAAKGEVKIYYIRPFLNKFKIRNSEKPEIETISDEDFEKLFPYEITGKEFLNEPKKTLVYSKKVNTEKDKTIPLDFISNFKSGSYEVVFTARDSFNNLIEATTDFKLTQSKDKFDPSKLFTVQQVNDDPKKDGFVEIKLTSPIQELYINTSGNYKNALFFEETSHLQNNEVVVKIPLKPEFEKILKISFESIFENQIFNDDLAVTLKSETPKLEWTASSFRTKIEPGSTEKWSFQLKASNTKKEAEVLASMYDSSLDKLAFAQWSGLSIYDYNYNSGNRKRILGFVQIFRTLENLNTYVPKMQYSSESTSLIWFGFDFNDPNATYLQNQYLKQLTKKVKKPANAKLISGILTDTSGLPLPGVSITVKNTKRTATSDFDGYYEIEAVTGEELAFSYLGLKSTSVKVTNDKVINLSLEDESSQLREVVVTGYGTQKKMSVTGSVTQVSTSSFKVEADNNVYNTEGLLSGTVSGVEVTQVPSDKIMIRGTSSITATNLLYIIDGEIADEKAVKNLNSSDVISISVLKEQEATALYGNKGANGAIIITTKKALEELTQVKARKNLSETAFFLPHLKTDSKGNISFNFTSPEALTSWKLRLLAHNKDAVTGYLEKSIITQKELMVLPNFPRFLREKDTIVISAKISNVTNEAKTGIASLQFFDATTMQPIDAKMLNTKNIKNFTISAFGNTSVNWTITIPEGLQGVQYKIVAKSGNFSDGEENILPVLTNNMLVTESIPLWVRENSTKEYAFDNLKNNTSSTLRNHQFILEYTSNPTWIAIQSLPYLMEYEHECAEQTFSRFYANALASEIISRNPKIASIFETWRKNGKLHSKLEENEELKSIILAETPWLNDAQSEDEKKKNLALLFDLEKMKTSQEATFQKLKKKQSASGGFPWFEGSQENEYITRHILAGLGHLGKLSKSEDNDQKIDQIAKTGIPYIDNFFLEFYRTRIKYLKPTERLIWINPYSDLHYLYTRSFYLEKYPMSEELKKASQLYLETAKKDWLQYSLYEKGLLAITLNRFGEKETAKKIIESLKETASNNEDWGMYWIANKSGWYWYQAPIETQALLIEAFAEVINDNKSVDAMKVWLLKNKQSKNWPTTKSTTEAIYALLMQGTDWLSVKDNTVIKLGDEKIVTKKLSENEKETETGYIKLNWKADEIKKEMASIKIQNKSKVPGFGGVYWQYFEDLDKIKNDSGAVLSVSKELYLKKNTAKGDELQKITAQNTLQIGDLVTVRLIITSKEDTEYVHLKDMRASCFEPVDVLSEYKYKDRLGFYMSTKDAATHFFFDHINKGTYVLEYDIRVNNGGEFSNGITTIQSMYAPEFSSHTKGIRVKVQ
ncbi:alpha-2-macroglobulin family protein [Flavobacterium sp. LHD-80]|uniref:alpha-2-macroglobulin family protein n=1 Tax=Flavobacterium sp. LHD-80 TaxID=3071411 RepID=UPI0027E15B43|nr:alpha-2-macroglobulin family protein [Flavobacterium sp. LHD-80]MDQ6471980.1 alpha-2-macroglobulin family protein [Flavobacterium sp. LHD-80]